MLINYLDNSSHLALQDLSSIMFSSIGQQGKKRRIGNYKKLIFARMKLLLSPSFFIFIKSGCLVMLTFSITSQRRNLIQKLLTICSRVSTRTGNTLKPVSLRIFFKSTWESIQLFGCVSKKLTIHQNLKLGNLRKKFTEESISVDFGPKNDLFFPF